MVEEQWLILQFCDEGNGGLWMEAWLREDCFGRCKRALTRGCKGSCYGGVTTGAREGCLVLKW